MFIAPRKYTEKFARQNCPSLCFSKLCYSRKKKSDYRKRNIGYNEKMFSLVTPQCATFIALHLRLIIDQVVSLREILGKTELIKY